MYSNLLTYAGKFFIRTLLAAVWIFLLGTCQISKQEKPSIEGVWAGEYIHIAWRFPYPVVYDFKKDGSLVKTIFSKEKQVQHLSWRLHDTLLIIDTTHYKLIRLTENELIFADSYYRAFYRPQTMSKRTSLAGLNHLLQAHAWQIKEKPVPEKMFMFDKPEILRFMNGKMQVDRKYVSEGKTLYAEKEEFCYTIEPYDDYFFLLKRGFTDSCTMVEVQFEQIIEASKDGFSLLDKKNIEKPITQYRIAPKQTIALTNTQLVADFYVCNEPFILQYFGIGTQYTGGQRAINQYILSHYIPPDTTAGQSGYISVRFIVNCAGKTGRFTMEQFSLDYKPKKFNPLISHQLFALTRNLQHWLPGKTDDGIVSDSYRHITYRLESGKITEIVP